MDLAKEEKRVIISFMYTLEKCAEEMGRFPARFKLMVRFLRMMELQNHNGRLVILTLGHVFYELNFGEFIIYGEDLSPEMCTEFMELSAAAYAVLEEHGGKVEKMPQMPEFANPAIPISR